MKKIKSIQQLQSKKKQIEQQQEELEGKVRKNWEELKYNLKPANMVKDAIGSFIKNKTAEKPDSGDILKSSFTYGMRLLAGRIADRIGQKLSSRFKS